MADDNEYLATLLAVATGPATSFVVFEGGTVVAFAEPLPSVDLASAARELMTEFGPVHVGSSAGDFGVVCLPDARGWVVTSHHPDIFTLVLPDEASETSSDHVVGLLGRSKRDRDAKDLQIAAIADRRPA